MVSFGLPGLALSPDCLQYEQCSFQSWLFDSKHQFATHFIKCHSSLSHIFASYRRVDEVLKGLSGCFTIIKKFIMGLQKPSHWITKCRFILNECCWAKLKVKAFSRLPTRKELNFRRFYINKKRDKIKYYFHSILEWYSLILWIFSSLSMNGRIWSHQYLFAHILLGNTIFPLFWRGGRFILKDGKSFHNSQKAKVSYPDYQFIDKFFNQPSNCQEQKSFQKIEPFTSCQDYWKIEFWITMLISNALDTKYFSDKQ